MKKKRKTLVHVTASGEVSIDDKPLRRLPFEPFAGARYDGNEIAAPALFLKNKVPFVYKSLLKLFRWDGGINSYVVVRERTEPGEALSLSMSMWGHDAEFVITMTLPTGKMVKRVVRRGRKLNVKDHGYMGLGVVARAPYVGEQHRRAHDGYDGAFSEESWNAILLEILANNLLEIHDWAKVAKVRQLESKRVRGGVRKRGRVLHKKRRAA